MRRHWAGRRLLAAVEMTHTKPFMRKRSSLSSFASQCRVDNFSLSRDWLACLCPRSEIRKRIAFALSRQQYPVAISFTYQNGDFGAFAARSVWQEGRRLAI